MQQVTSYPQVLGQIVKTKRASKNWNQLQLAQRVGMDSASGWSRIESGDTTMTISQLCRVARELETSPGKLLSEVDSAIEAMTQELPGLQIRDEKPKKTPSTLWLITGAALGGLVAGALAAAHLATGNGTAPKTEDAEG